MHLRSRLIGCGSCLPQKIVTNDDLAKTIDTSDEWIRKRTGIGQRHVAAADEKTSDLAIAAARQALSAAGERGEDIDLVILATTTPDLTFPATAPLVQAAIGASGFAFDVQAVCSGFIFALSSADALLRTRQATRALVIGAETFSRILDWQDRGTCVLFGDGAGAVVLRAEPGSNSLEDRGVLSTHLHSDGRFQDVLRTSDGPGSTGAVGVVRMEGREVFRHAVTKLGEVVEEALLAHGLNGGDIDWLVPHQANIRIIDGMANKLGLPRDRVIVTIERHGNTSAASVPLALAEGVADGRIREGHLVLMEAIGGGLTWAAGLIRM